MASLREINPDGCTVTGHGRNSDVYSLNDGRIAKVFNKGTVPDEEIENEYRKAVASYQLGVPTPRCYELARFRGSLCIIYERIEARNLRELIAEDNERIEELIGMGAELSRNLHKIRAPRDIFPSMAEIYHVRADSVSDLFTSDEVEKLHRLIDSIPEGDTFVHGDYHRGNIMLRDGELMVIDMADAAYGHPIYDVLSTYMYGPFIIKIFTQEAAEKLTGWTPKIINRVWDVFVRNYFGVYDKAVIERIEDNLLFFCILRYITFLHILPGLPEEMIRSAVSMAREVLFPFVDERIETVKKGGLYGF
ncbi:hypothetical protein BXO88_14745 [Oribacterium sp. C9]|uniref:phosphotransferase n=1 Tax=Oribacterium sp. C9 TaxID=1943579 RepID=UPI0009903252|nr:phosphotransferase [Oribacterium sp. C9]OON84980.1 hypothetical protein BXO88_14745 [Oribacterium sp. C9]